MADQVVTELVIDSAAAERGAAQYARAMEQAQSATQRSLANIEQMLGGLDRRMLSLGVGAAAAGVAVAAGIGKAVEFVIEANAKFADLDRIARQTFTTVEKYQQLRFAGRSAGLGDDAFAEGFSNATRLLNEAQRAQNSLSRLFEANGLSIRQNNGALLTGNQLLDRAAELIKRAANENDKIDIAKMLGLSREWVPLLEQGARAMNDVASQASAAGVIISDETVKKAKQFDDEWKKASAQFSAGLKEAVADVIPEITRLILSGVDAIRKFREAAKDGPGMLEQGQDMAGDVQKVWNAIKALNVNEVYSAIAGDAGRATKTVDDLIMALQNLGRVSGEIQGARGAVGSFSVGDVFGKDSPGTRAVDEITGAEAALYEATRKANAELERQRRLALDKPGAGASIIPGGDPAKADDLARAWEKQLIALSRRNAIMEAEARTAGKGVAAQAALRTELVLQDFLWQKSGQDLEKYTALLEKYGATIARESQRSGGAAEGLARARIASEIGFQRDTAFLSPQDVQIARQLAGIYGTDVPAALASSEAAAIRLNNAFKEIGDGLRDIGKSVFSAFLQGKDVMESLIAATDRLAEKLASSAFDNILQGVATGNWAQAGIGAVQAGASALLSLFGRNQRERQERAKFEAQVAREAQQLTFREKGIGLDTNTREGARQQLWLQHTQENMALEHNANLKQILNIQRKEMEELNRQWDKRELEALEAKREAALQRQLSFQDRVFAATNDASTLEGRLAALDRQYERERAAEIRAGGEAIVDLEEAYQAERSRLIRDAAAEQLEEQRRAAEEQRRVAEEAARFLQGIARGIRDYLNSLQTGDQSVLDPAGRLQAALTQFNEQKALALTGDRDALSNITRYAGTLLEQARGYFASGAGYTSVYDAVVAGLEQVEGISPAAVVDQDAALLAAVNATTVAVEQTTGAVHGTTDTVETGNAQLQAINNLTAISVSVADRIIAALNGLGGITAEVGSENLRLLYALHGDLLSLIANAPVNGGNGTIWNWLGFAQGGRIPGYATGGLVGNGIAGIDSVMARYADGGAIMLAGREYVTQTASVNAATLPMLEFINSFGRLPANDNGRIFEGLAGLARTNAAGFSALAAELRELRQAVYGGAKMQSDATRQKAEQPRQPGTSKAAA